LCYRLLERQIGRPGGQSLLRPLSGWEARLPVTIRQTHLGGDKLFVDYAGDTVPVIVDRRSGEVRRAHVFVAVMGARAEGARETWPLQKGGDGKFKLRHYPTTSSFPKSSSTRYGLTPTRASFLTLQGGLFLSEDDEPLREVGAPLPQFFRVRAGVAW
jgi:hypothetical protein